MKVLFAVSNEEISESIVKKYQKEYKQIISYKNVYYFNAILKELQKDKNYDRIVISEDLEAFTHTQYDQIDKFIFEKLDGISDEASSTKGNDIPIILICSDRRAKGEQILIKLFGIGIYNAIIGTDRSVDEVCKLINRPRSKKEAKSYYQIDTEDVGYRAETENDVSEMEIQNIIAHYKRLGKNEERYVDSFNNIAAQYNDAQLRIISKFLPLNVRAVLEEQSTKYQQIMSFNSSVSENLRYTKEEEKNGPSETLLKSKNRDTIMSKPVVIPSAVNVQGGKKLSRQKIAPVQVHQVEEQAVRQVVNERPVEIQRVNEPQKPVQEQRTNEFQRQHVEVQRPTVSQTPKVEINELKIEEIQEQEQEQELELKPEVVETVKRGRGRPRKNPVLVEDDNQPKRGRGRPKKKVEIPEQVVMEDVKEIEEQLLPGLEEESEIEINKYSPEVEVPQMEETYLPGFDDEEEEDKYLPGLEEENKYLPGFDDEDKYEEKQQSYVVEESKPNGQEDFLPGFGENDNELLESQQTYQYYNSDREYSMNQNRDNYVVQINQPNDRNKTYQSTIDLSKLLTPDKKIVSFVGTSKNGTSFMVNNIAELMSSIGVNTVILDTTKNRNSYYIYTKNEEELRDIAAKSIDGLIHGSTRGISVNKNLTVYTSLPNEGGDIFEVDSILETLLKTYSLILIDADFDTPIGYFKESQETYLVQTYDVLTIQPLTAFLRELKAKNVLDEKKLRVVLNKAIKIRGVSDKTIIGGMAYYNDPAMSFMTELFDRTLIKYISVPLDEEVYYQYLQSIIECNISLKGYSKNFVQTLKELGNMIYPVVNNSKSTYQPPSATSNQEGVFSSNMNNTLDQMKRRY